MQIILNEVCIHDHTIFISLLKLLVHIICHDRLKHPGCSRDFAQIGERRWKIFYQFTLSLSKRSISRFIFYTFESILRNYSLWRSFRIIINVIFNFKRKSYTFTRMKNFKFFTTS